MVCCGLYHRQRSGSDTEADATWTVVPAVAAFAVDLSVRSVVEVGRVQRFSAVETAEASLVPDQVLAQHLLGLVHGASAAPAALAVLGLHAGIRVELGIDGSSLHFGRHQGGRVSESESLGSKQLSVAGTAVNLLVRSIAGQHRIQRPVALVTVEALLVPHGTLG